MHKHDLKLVSISALLDKDVCECLLDKGPQQSLAGVSGRMQRGDRYPEIRSPGKEAVLSKGSKSTCRTKLQRQLNFEAFSFTIGSNLSYSSPYPCQLRILMDIS